MFRSFSSTFKKKICIRFLRNLSCWEWGFHIFAIIDSGAVNIFTLIAFLFSLIISLEKVPRSGFTRSKGLKVFMARASWAILLFRRLV